MKAIEKSIIGRKKVLLGTVANPVNHWKWGSTPTELPNTLPHNITPYTLNYGKDEVHFVKTPADYDLRGKPFLYHEQYARAEKVYVVSHDEWFKWLKTQPMPEKPIFVCGIGRSGTTLINRAFHQLPYVDAYDEPDVFSQIVRLPHDERIPLIQASTASFNKEGKRLVIKQRAFSAFILESLLDAYPDAKVLFLYRNTYDWIRSNMNLILRVPWWPNGIVHELVTVAFKRYLPMLNAADFRPLQMVEAGALLWLEFNSHYAKMVEQGYPILGVRFEDLVDEPEAMMSQIFDFCDLPASDVQTALEAFERNSQKGTIFSKKYLADVELNERQINLINGMLERHEWLNDPDIRLPGSVVPRKPAVSSPMAQPV